MQLSHLRPLSVGEILDGAFTLYRRHFGEFFLAALLPQLPLVVLWLVWGPLVGGAAAGTETTPWMAIGGMAVFFPLLIVASILAYVVPAGAVTRLAADAYLGNPVDRAAALRATWGKLFPLLATVILMGFAFGIGFMLCIIPGVLAWIALFAAVPGVVLEGRDPVDTLGRSVGLAKGAWGQIFVVQFLLWLITVIPTLGVAFFTNLGVALLSPSEAAAVSMMGVSNAMQALTTALTIPLTLTGTTLLYYDRRVRTEAFGLDADLDALETAGADAPLR